MRHVEDARVIAGGTRPTDVSAAFAAVRALLAGSGPALLPRPTPSHATTTAPAVPPGVAVVLATSGSSGATRNVALGLDAVRASAAATHARLGGTGTWLVALPIHHVAGFQILVRAALAGPTAPAVLDTTNGFSAQRLAQVVTQARPRYASLVPTQLVRVLADDAATTALASLDAILVGGAAAPAELLERARAAGLRVVETYGMTETGGGCVYDGEPLDGVEVAAIGGRLEISGPVLAAGYLTPDGRVVDSRSAAGADDSGRRGGGGGSDGAGGSGRGRGGSDGTDGGAGGGGSDADGGTGGGDADGGPADAAFFRRAGRRWLRTPDLGELDGAGHVRVLGRADQLIVTGGMKVHPEPVERVLLSLPAVAEAVVVGVSDAEWGSAVTAVVVAAAGQDVPDLATVRAAVAARLGRTHAPRSVLVVPELPLVGPGKLDRVGAARLAADILAGPGSPEHRTPRGAH